MYRQTSSKKITNPNETTIGLTTVRVVKSESDPPRFDITWTRTSPTTSSSIAALVSTVPRRDAVNPLAPRIENVVPKLVAQRAAPAANDWRGVADISSPRTNEKPIGNAMPVRATATERIKFAFREANEVERPPGRHILLAADTLYIFFL